MKCYKSTVNKKTQEAVPTAQYTAWTYINLQQRTMALRLIITLGLASSAAAAPLDTSGFQFDFNQFFGTAAAQGTKGSMNLQDGSRTSITGLGRTTFGETSGKAGAIRNRDAKVELDAGVNTGSSTFNTPGGGASSSTWGRADTSATQQGVGAAEISLKSGTLDSFGSGATSFFSSRGGGVGSRSIVESLSKSFLNAFGTGSSGKATGETSGTGANQVDTNFQSQAQYNGLGGISSAMSMGNAGGTTSNGQRANVLTQHQTFTNGYMAATSSQSRASLAG